MRCRRCGKVIYWTRQHATNAARRVSEQFGRAKKHRMRVYLGSCGHWHLTRTKTMAEHLGKALIGGFALTFLTKANDPSPTPKPESRP